VDCDGLVIHDHLPYSSLCFFPRLTAFNINWHEAPVRRIDSYAPPKGCLTQPGMPNHQGSHASEYAGFPTLVKAARTTEAVAAGPAIREPAPGPVELPRTASQAMPSRSARRPLPSSGCVGDEGALKDCRLGRDDGLQTADRRPDHVPRDSH